MSPSKNEFARLIEHVRYLLEQGIEQSYFQFSVSVKAKGDDKREVHVSAGKVEKFVVRLSDDRSN